MLYLTPRGPLSRTASADFEQIPGSRILDPFWAKSPGFFLKKVGLSKTGFPYVFLADPCPESCKKGPAAQKCFFTFPRPQGGTRARARRASGETRAEILYEVARLAEVSNDEQIARDLYEEILDLHPAFTPAEIACSRLLLLDGDWKGVAAIWERSLARTESEIEQIGISFRLGFIYERRLSHLPNALQRALDHYARVASLRSSSAAALHAMVRIAQQLGRYDLVADSISSLIPLCLDRDLKASCTCAPSPSPWRYHRAEGGQ